MTVALLLEAATSDPEGLIFTLCIVGFSVNVLLLIKLLVTVAEIKKLLEKRK